MRRKAVSPDVLVARIAAQQHGVVTVAQLLGCGLSEAGIRRRVAAGRLHRIHRGVYAVGDAGLSRHGEWKAAVLACGEGAALSHRSAAELWGMLEPEGGAIHVTVPVAGGRNRRRGLRIHRCPSLTRAAVTRREAIEVTRPDRTLTDLSPVTPRGELRRAVR
jgi:predicted transcriptional regulator of viral defense system